MKFSLGFVIGLVAGGGVVFIIHDGIEKALGVLHRTVGVMHSELVAMRAQLKELREKL